MNTSPVLTISDVALGKLRAVMDEQPLEPEERNVRIYVQGGGCCGPSVGLAFDKRADDDVVVDVDGLSVLVDPVSEPFVRGAAVDFVETPEVTGFKITTVPRPHGDCRDTCESGPGPGGGCGCGGCGC